MARTDTLGHYLTDVADAIRAKGGTSATITASDFDTAIANLPSGGTTVEKNDVTYFDYDGTILYSYTKAQFLQLSAHPESPTYDDLTFEKWNWDLSDAKTYVTKWGKLNIGAQCYTTDDKDHIYIKTPKNNSTLTLFLHAAGTTSSDKVDWGDGSPEEDITNNGAYTTNNHTYATAGEYVIKVTNTSNHLHFANFGTNTRASFLRNGSGNSQSSYNSTPISWVTKIAFSKYYDYYNSNGVFAGMPNLRAIALSSNSKGILNYGQYNFRYSPYLKYITCPDGLTSLSSNAFQDTGLEHISFPKSFKTLNGSCLLRTRVEELYFPENTSGSLSSTCCQACYQAKEIICPIVPSSGGLTNQAFDSCMNTETLILGEFTTINLAAIASMQSLKELKVPSTVTSISQNSYGLMSLMVLDFSDHTAIPSLSSSTALNNVNTEFKIIVPDDLYSTWITTGNWGSYSSHIVKASEA